MEVFTIVMICIMLFAAVCAAVNAWVNNDPEGPLWAAFPGIIAAILIWYQYITNDSIF